MEEITSYDCGYCPNCGTDLTENYEHQPTLKGEELYYIFTCPKCYLSGREWYNVDYNLEYNCSIIEGMTAEEREIMIHDNIQAQHDREAEGIKPLF